MFESLLRKLRPADCIRDRTLSLKVNHVVTITGIFMALRIGCPRSFGKAEINTLKEIKQTFPEFRNAFSGEDLTFWDSL